MDGMYTCPLCDGEGYDSEESKMLAIEYAYDQFVEFIGKTHKTVTEEDIDAANSYAEDNYEDHLKGTNETCQCELCKGTGKIDWVTKCIRKEN